jgi:hypothetical protein
MRLKLSSYSEAISASSPVSTLTSKQCPWAKSVEQLLDHRFADLY